MSEAHLQKKMSGSESWKGEASSIVFSLRFDTERISTKQVDFKDSSARRKVIAHL